MQPLAVGCTLGHCLNCARYVNDHVTPPVRSECCSPSDERVGILQPYGNTRKATETAISRRFCTAATKFGAVWADKTKPVLCSAIQVIPHPSLC